MQSSVNVIKNEIHNMLATFPNSSDALSNIDNIVDKFSNPSQNLKPKHNVLLNSKIQTLL